MKVQPVTLSALLILTLSGCYSPAAYLPRGEDAYKMVPAADPGKGPAQYRIGLLDTLSIRTFQEPDLSFEKIQVDAGGNINFPLVGTVRVVGKSPIELSRELENGLSARYIVNPQVVVGVETSAAQRVVVEGNVIEPGVYEVSGSSSLMESIARAKGLTRVAQVNEIVVFRQINGQRMGAVFNLKDIREGRAQDPEILGGDQIVVGFNAIKGAYRDFIAAAPVFNAFRNF